MTCLWFELHIPRIARKTQIKICWSNPFLTILLRGSKQRQKLPNVMESETDDLLGLILLNLRMVRPPRTSILYFWNVAELVDPTVEQQDLNNTAWPFPKPIATHLDTNLEFCDILLLLSGLCCRIRRYQMKMTHKI
jgi:hypothetical protein